MIDAQPWYGKSMHESLQRMGGHCDGRLTQRRGDEGIQASCPGPSVRGQAPARVVVMMMMARALLLLQREKEQQEKELADVPVVQRWSNVRVSAVKEMLGWASDAGNPHTGAGDF